MAMMFRHGDPRFPFLWQQSSQPAARGHGDGDGPVQYLADTPDGAWAEFLRHEEITDPVDLAGVRRRLWAVEFDPDAEVVRDVTVARGGRDSHQACQADAAALRADGATCLRAPSAALHPGAARGQVCTGGLHETGSRDGIVWVLIGTRTGLRGWATVDTGATTDRVLRLVEHFRPVTQGPQPQH